MKQFEWLTRLLFGEPEQAPSAKPDRQVATDGRAPTGYWLPSNEEAEPSREERQEQLSRE